MRIRQTWLRCDAGDKRQRKRSTPNVVKYHRKKKGVQNQVNQVNPEWTFPSTWFRTLGNVPFTLEYLVKSPDLLGSVPNLGVYLVLYFFLLGKITFSQEHYPKNQTS